MTQPGDVRELTSEVKQLREAVAPLAPLPAQVEALTKETRKNRRYSWRNLFLIVVLAIGSGVIWRVVDNVQCLQNVRAKGAVYGALDRQALNKLLDPIFTPGSVKNPTDFYNLYTGKGGTKTHPTPGGYLYQVQQDDAGRAAIGQSNAHACPFF